MIVGEQATNGPQNQNNI